MKVTLVLAVAVAALGGALLASVLRADGRTDAEPARVVVQQQPADTARQTTVANREGDRTARRDRSSRQQAAASRFVEPDDLPIGRRQLDRVRDAAVRAAGSGTVTDIDRSDDLGVAYEVELVRNGQEIDVRLDRRLALVATDYSD